MAPGRAPAAACAAVVALLVGAAASGPTWEVETGALANGDDVLTPGDYSLADAEAACGAEPLCLGFTWEHSNATTHRTYFKSAVNLNGDPAWRAVIKVVPPVYPDVNFTVGGLAVGLRQRSRTVQLLGLVGDDMPPYNFSFVPPLVGWKRPTRTAPRCQHLGDVTLRVQPISETNASAWATYASAYVGDTVEAKPLPGPLPAGTLAAHDITALLAEPTATFPGACPHGSRTPTVHSRTEDGAGVLEGVHECLPGPLRGTNAEFPLGLRVVRSYEQVAADGSPGTGALVLRLNISVPGDAKSGVRVGGLGFALPADDNWGGLQLDEIAHIISFVDPHIGADRAFAEWTRVVGNHSLLVLPHTPETKMEGWRPLLEDCQFNGGMGEWTVLTAAWAKDWERNCQSPFYTLNPALAARGVWPHPLSPWPEWHGSETFRSKGPLPHWNEPTSLELQPGQTASFALRFVLQKQGPRARDDTMRGAGQPVVHAVPGYVVATDMNSAHLFVEPPKGTKLEGLTVSPPGVLALGKPESKLLSRVVRVGTTGLKRGRARVGLRFSDGTEMAVHYYVVPPLREQIALAGHHWANVAWLPKDYPDPFGRGASVMPWDREDKRHVIQDSRAYIVGLSDDAGAGQNLGFSMLTNFAPTQEFVDRLDEYIALTLLGTKPDVAKGRLRSLQIPETHQVRMTMFYYGQTLFPYNYTEEDKCTMPVGGPIWCMTEHMANMTYRAYNYPHQTSPYWAMYRAARNYDMLKTAHPWQMYLEHAYLTTKAFGSPSVGVMDGTIFREVLKALQEEGAENQTIAGWAEDIDSLMKRRADGWSQQQFPYGSEFNFDTTGQEEVFVWLQHYNYTDAAARTLEAVLAYMRSLPNWAWHGGSRSMGDLGNNGKIFVNRGTERGLMHYRAGLNMIPLLEAYRADPDQHILLEIAMGAITGQMTNIDADGAVSMMFHSFPFVLDHDPHSGDYGLGFFGNTLEVGAYLVQHKELGWLCFLCDVAEKADGSPRGKLPWPSKHVTLTVLDSYRRRVYLEPLGLHLVAEAGLLQSVEVDLRKKLLVVTFAPAATELATVRLYSSLRLRVTAEARTRPAVSVTLVDPKGAPVVRGAFEFKPAPDDAQTTVVTLAWRLKFIY